MAISHDSEWSKQADEATKRRLEKNIPWDMQLDLMCSGLNKALDKVGASERKLTNGELGFGREPINIDVV